MAVPCVNCRKDVPPEEGKVFKGVYVCPSCHLLAERSLENLERELRHLLLLAGESIRIALIESRLQFAEASTDGTLSKKQLLEAILSVPEAKGARHG